MKNDNDAKDFPVRLFHENGTEIVIDNTKKFEYLSKEGWYENPLELKNKKIKKIEKQINENKEKLKESLKNSSKKTLKKNQKSAV